MTVDERNQLMIDNKNLVYMIVDQVIKKSRGRRKQSVSRADLIQDGMVALLNAVTGYDASRELTFSTYAYTVIRNTVHASITNSQLVVIPYNTDVKARKFIRGKPIKMTRAVKDALILFNTKTTPFYEDSIRDYRDNTNYNEVMEYIHYVMSKFDEKTREIITLRFGLGGSKPLDFRGIGLKVGLCHETVRKIFVKAINFAKGL